MSSQKTKYLSVIALGVSAGAIYTIPYIKFVFYDPLINVMQATNEQLGWLITIYSLISTVLFIPGGIIADKYSCKKIVVVSNLVTAVLCVWYALSLNYMTAVVIWIILPFSTAFAFFAASLKAVRLIGGATEQGKFNGWYQGVTGFALALITLLATQLFNLYAEESEGLRMIVMFFAFVNVLGAILVHIFCKIDEADAEAGEKINVRQIITIAKEPVILYISLIVFSIYGLYVAQSYLTPYLTSVLGLSLPVAVLLSTIRIYFLRFFAAPAGGILADKMGSASRTIVMMLTLLAFLVVIFIFVSSPQYLVIVMALMLIITVLTFCSYGIMWSTLEEAQIPKQISATAVGIIAIIGYLPDLFIHTLFGYWLDKYGNDGFTLILWFLIVLAAVGVVGAVGVSRSIKKMVK